MAVKNFQVGIKLSKQPRKGGTKQDNTEGGGVPLPAKTPKCQYDNPTTRKDNTYGTEPVL